MSQTLTLSPTRTVEPPRSIKCPFAEQEFQNIRAHHGTLASTGCTKEFCQAGRAIHTDEPRIGENRSLSSVEQDAQNFLLELYREGFYNGEEAFQKRKEQVLSEIRAGAIEGIVRHDRSRGLVAGNWTQTAKELKFGVQRAWRNSRKCIMRSHCEELELCDFRTVRSSEGMATQLLKAVRRAFNEGNIQPTAFVFPPREINSRGPMIWNHQILQFAGYDAGDGSVIGDPMSVELTKCTYCISHIYLFILIANDVAIIDLGWEPPQEKGKWDLLPLVTMADHDDKPYIAEIPADIGKLVDIRHPAYMAEFEKLNLKWVPFPALTRLGFDIGGVQYSAAPFIGWQVTSRISTLPNADLSRFMDAEIGVRNLADPFRYNVGQDIIREIGLTNGKFNDDVEEFEDLHESEKLWMMSRAQAELNYAVHWSFSQARVTITDSLTASKKYSRYDDDFQKKTGFRLPSDPYWLAPPQGSIIPLWHRGGAPNYQPKPMICKHVQDPLKAWEREKNRGLPALGPPRYAPTLHTPVDVFAQLDIREGTVPNIKIKTRPCVEKVRVGVGATIQELICPHNDPGTLISVYYCSAGTIAERLAAKLHKWVQKLVRGSSFISLKPHIEPLNNVRGSDLIAKNIILVVASSTGQGEIPNGEAFTELCEQLMLSAPPGHFRDFKFSILGNGDSRYSNTFNGGAIKLHGHFKRLGGIPLAGGLFNGDIAMNPFPLGSLKTWLTKLEPSLTQTAVQSVQWIQRPGATTITKNNFASPVTISVLPSQGNVQQYDNHQQQLLSTLKDGAVVSTSPQAQKEGFGSLLLDLSVSGQMFEEMSCIQVLPINASSKVRRALLALHIQPSTNTNLSLEGTNLSYTKFLTEFVDLELPFMKFEWLDSIPSAASQGLTKDSFGKLSILEALESLNSIITPLCTDDAIDIRRKLCLDMPLLRTRTYSLASSHLYNSRLKKSADTINSERKICVMTKIIPGGRFSSTFLTESPHPALLKYRIVDSLCGPQLRRNYLAPFIIVAIGAGFGPVRALLQWRIATTVAAGRTLPPLKRGVSLFLGLKECDIELCLDVLNEALALDLIDVLNVVISNAEKRRVYAELPRHGRLVREKVVKGRGVVFVCASKDAEEGTRRAFDGVLGGSVKEILGERYLREVF